MRNSLIISFVFLVGFCQAQQRVQYSQYLQNGYLVNPAVTGVENYMNIKSGYTNQWVGFDGAPKSYYVSLHSPLSFKKDSVVEETLKEIKPPLPMRGRSSNLIKTSVAENNKETSDSNENLSFCQKLRHGVGGYVYNETMGPLANRGMALSYAVHYPVGNYNVAIGVSFGILNYEFNPDGLQLINPDDATFGVTTMNDYMPNLNLGGLFYSEKLFVGISSRQILGNKFTVNDTYSELSSQLSRHYLLNGGYRLSLMDGQLQLTPSLMFRYVSPAPASVDVNLQANFKNIVFGGISYRHKDALIGILGVNLNKTFTLSYSYDYTLSTLSSYSSGTHGIVIGARVGYNKQTPQTKYFW